MQHFTAIVDDHPIVRDGLSSLFSKQPDFDVCGEADDVASALKLVEKTKPHVVTIDILLETGSGLELIRRIAQLHRSIRLLACSLHDVESENGIPIGNDTISTSRCEAPGLTYAYLADTRLARANLVCLAQAATGDSRLARAARSFRD